MKTHDHLRDALLMDSGLPPGQVPPEQLRRLQAALRRTRNWACAWRLGALACWLAGGLLAALACQARSGLIGDHASDHFGFVSDTAWPPGQLLPLAGASAGLLLLAVALSGRLALGYWRRQTALRRLRSGRP